MSRLLAYLDHNASAPVLPEARRAMLEALELCGNPSSVHRSGRAARRLLEQAREQVAELLGAAPENVVFTSGGTEANNLALGGTRAEWLITTAIEHDSVLAAAAARDATVIPVHRSGLVDLEALAKALRSARGPVLVSVMLANNETGVIQPLSEVVALARRHGALVHTDAVQAAARMPLDFAALGVDLLSVSGHKMGGPQGVGALVVREGLPLGPRLIGGGQERGRRAGTENLAGIAGFGAAAAALRKTLPLSAGIAALRDEMERRLQAFLPAAPVWGGAAPRLGNTTCIGLPGVPGETQVMALDLAGIAVSAGAACSSGKVRVSHVLQAMGATPAEAGSAIRISLGPTTSAAEVDRLVAAWTGLAARLGSQRRGVAGAAGSPDRAVDAGRPRP